MIPQQPKDTPSPEKVTPTHSNEVEVHNAITVLDTSKALLPAEAIGIPTERQGMQEEVAAKVSLPYDEENNLSFAIIKSSGVDGSSRFYLQGLLPDPKTGVDVVPAYLSRTRTEITSEGLLVGRNADQNELVTKTVAGSEVPASAIWGTGVQYSDMVSKMHMSMQIVNGEVVIGDTSTNGTKVEAAAYDPALAAELPFMPPKPTERIYKDISMEKRYESAEAMGLIDQQGRFIGHPIIDGVLPAQIDGMVDLANFRGTGGEAVVIDSDTEAGLPAYVRLMTTFNEEAAKPESNIDTPLGIAVIIKETVTKSIAYDLSVERGDTPMTDPGRRVGLSEYLNEGKGVCVQMALTAAWLAAKVAEAGHLNGWTISIERNKLRTGAESYAHEFLRMNNSDGTAIIIDPMANIAETLFDLSRREADTGQQNKWGYLREEEVQQYAERIKVQRQAETSAAASDGFIQVPDWIKRSLQ